MRPVHTFLLRGILLCLLLANAANSDTACNKGCPKSDNGTFKFSPGKMYEYSFDSIMTVGFGSSTAGDVDGTSLKLLGTAKIFAQGNCGYTLQLGAIKVIAPESIEKKIMQSIQKPVFFAMVNGQLEPELCVDPSDNQYALNVKRAIVSLLPANLENGIEVDVFGQCETHSSVSKVGAAQVITKMRDLNACGYRENTKNGLIHGVINQAAGVKSTHLFKASYAKELKLNNGIVENVQLVEEYDFGGTEKGSPIIRGKVVTSLKVKNTAGSAAAPPQTGTQSRSIIFQKPETYAVKNGVALKTALVELVNLLDVHIKKNSAKGFLELIRLMRNADTDTLLDLSATAHPNKVLARKAYLDALFRTGTAESAKAILRQINKMDDKEKAIAIIALNIVQSVDKDTLNQAMTLLTSNAPKQVYLSVGSLVSKYCKMNSCDGNEIETISKKYTDNLKHCKANTKKDEERIIYVLKGIANMNNLANSATAALTECVTTGRATRIRVAALQAFFAANCDQSLTEQALSILRDRNEDSEIRIEAYLAAIQCPSGFVANSVADIVNSEAVYQVGGFISSHLKTIRDSTDVTRANQRHHLGNIRVTKHFPHDYRRFSFNNELSYNLDALGVGATTDYRLIYSQHGFLPRSARVNLTTEIFGTKYNILEASLRQENLENILEYFIGPKGLLSKNFDEIMEVIQVSDGEDVVSGGRSKRSIVDETTKFGKKYKNYGSKSVQHVNLDLSLKIFGTEMMFLSLGDHIPSSLDDIIKYVSRTFDNAKKELSAFNKEFNLHDLFLNVDAFYPTGLGIPLELSTHGFAANKLDFGINVEVDALLEQNWQRAKYRVKLVPSIDFTVIMQLGFNAYVVSTGMRVESSMHSATGADVKIDFINDGNGFNMDIEMPRDKLELVNVEIVPGFYLMEQDKPVKHIPTKEAQKHKDDNTHMCFNQLDNIGLNFCIDASGMAIGKEDNNNNAIDIYNLVRSVKFSAVAAVERKYNLRGSHVLQTETESQQWKLELQTPGSKESHSTSIGFEVGKTPRTYGRLTFENMQYHIALEAGINDDNKELVMYAQYESNDDIKRNRVGFLRNGNEYRPIIEIQDKNGVTNEINGYRLDGRVVMQKTSDKQTRYTFDNFQIVNNENKRIVVKGWSDVGPASLRNEMHVAVGKETYMVKSNFKIGNGIYEVGFFTNDVRKPDNVYGGSVLVEIGQKNYKVFLVGSALTWEADFENEVQYIISEGTTEVTSSKFKHALIVKHKRTVEAQFMVTGMAEGNNKLELNVELVRGKRVASIDVKYNGNQRTQGDYLIEMNGKYNKHFANLIAKCEFNGNHFVVDNTLSTSWGTVLILKGELGQRYTAQDIYIDIQATAQFNKKEKILQWLAKVTGTPEKTSGEFKLSRDNAEIMRLAGDLHHPQDKLTGGRLNMAVKNVLTAKADFKIAKNGKGDVLISMDTQRAEQKHKIDINSKFHVQTPKYDVEATITMDNEKKIYFKTESQLDKLKFFTKNIAEVDNKQVSFDANGSVKGEWRINGELIGNFVLTCPSGHVIDGSIKRKVTGNAKTGALQDNAELQVAEIYEGKKRSFFITAQADKFNLKTKEISQNVHLVYTNFDSKKLEVIQNIKHLLAGQNKMIDIKSTVRGDFLNLPIDFTFVVNEYDVKHAIYHIDYKYSDILNANINGKYHLEEGKKPATFEIQGNVQMPKTSFKTLQFSANGKLLKPADKTDIYIVELHLDEMAGNDQFVRLNTVWKSSQQQSAYNFDLQTNKMQGPLKFEGSYQQEQQGVLKDGTTSGKKKKYAFNFNYAEKYVKTTADVSYVSLDMATLRYTLDSSFESAKNVEIEVRAQKLDIDTYEVKVQTKNGNNVYTADSKIYQSIYKKGLDFHAKLPSGEPVVIIGIFEVLGERKGKLVIEIQNLAELGLVYNSEASFKNTDDFYIQSQWNSDKLNLQNYNLDIHSQGKGIVFNLKNAQGLVFAGSATYAIKTEKNKTTYEGQGQVQYKGKSQKTNFRLIHQRYDVISDEENGFSYTLDGTFGPKNGVSTLKITNKGFNVKLSMCEEKKQCTNVQVQSIVSNNEQETDAPQHSLLIVIDLRELGYPYEFEFQSKTNIGLKLQYSLDSQIVSNNNMKYKLVANVLPTNSVVQLNLPNREILLETKQQFPDQGQLFGYYENSATFYFDKTNKPNEVTRFIFNADVTGSELAAFNLKSELRFEHPTIRPLYISGKLDADRQQQIINTEVIFDVFRLPEQKIISSLRAQNTQQPHGFNITTSEIVTSEGLGFSYEFSGHTAFNKDTQVFSAGAIAHSGVTDLKASANVYATKEHTDISVYAINEPILLVAVDLNRQKYAIKVDSKLQVLSQAPVEVVSEVQPTMSKFTIKRQGLVDMVVDIKLGNEFKVNIDGAGKPLFNGRVALDGPNFLQTSYNSNSEQMKLFLSLAESDFKKDNDAIIEKIKARFEKIQETVNKQTQLLKDSIPDLSALKASYANNIADIFKELENDPGLKQLGETYLKMYTKITKIINELVKSVAESYVTLNKSLLSFYEKLEATVKETVLPAWEDFTVKTSKIIGELRIQIINYLKNAIKIIWDVLEQYGPALKNYGKAVNDTLKPLNETVQEMVKVITQAFEEFLEEVKEYVGKLPTFKAIQTEFKDQIKKLKLVEQTLDFLNKIFDQLHILPLTQEASAFIDKLQKYTEAKLNNQPVNDEQLLKELLKLLIKATRSIWNSVELSAPINAPSISDNVFEWLFGSTSETIKSFSKLPSLLSFRFSVFNFLLNENWEDLLTRDFLKSRMFYYDFNLNGHVADGHQIFTFDGQQYSFPGTCKYILAQDSIDNNFTVVAQMRNGKLNSIIVADRDGRYLEVTDTGILKIDGNAAEYPQNVGSMHTWRMFYTVWIHSEYGVEVMCTTDLKVCHVKVNGFYTSKMRGLLGNGNAEPYDDFVQIDGTIAPDYGKFGNGYGIGKCAPVAATPADNNKHAEVCTELFGLDSPLALGYIFENFAPYREACDKAVTEVPEKEKESVACTVAMAYASALSYRQYSMHLPSRCLKCAGAAGQRELGQEFTVKLPNNKADVVFVVDVDIAPAVLNNLVAPAINEVRESLKTRGFTDVQIAVIAYNDSQQYPALLTSDNGKLNYQGNLAATQLNGPKTFCLFCTSQDVIDPKIFEVLKTIERFLHSIEPQSDEKAFHMAVNYPFRAGAAKSVVAVRSNSLEFTNMFKLVRAHFTDAVTGFNGALLHLISPVKDMSVEGIPTGKLVGFNSRLIATLDGKDSKKRQKLQFENDMGIDFVLNNGGWIFTTHNFEQLKPSDQKKALIQVTNSIADSLFKTEIVSECECEAVHGLHAQHHCTIKSSTFVPNKKVKA